MKCLVVLGLPRGGTSIVAIVAHRLGVPMMLSTDPKSRQRHPGSRYPYGDHECSAITPLLWSLTDHYCVEPAARPLQSRYLTDFNDDEYILMTRWAMLRMAEAHNGWFGVKKPRLTSMMPAFHRLMQLLEVELYVIHIERNFEDAVNSVAEKRGPTHYPEDPYVWARAIQASNQWRLHMAVSAMRNLNVPILNTTFDEATLSPVTFVERVADFLKLPVDYSAVDMIDTSLVRA